MTETTKRRQQICPLCDADNDCAVAAGNTLGACWCMDEQFEESLLIQPTVSASSERCICRACLAKAQRLACAG